MRSQNFWMKKWKCQGKDQQRPDTTSSGGITNTYDFENRLLTHGSVTVVYDGAGNRVWETVGGTTTKFLVDSLNPTKLPQVIDERVSGL